MCFNKSIKSPLKKVSAVLLFSAIFSIAFAKIKVSKGPEFYFMAEYPEVSAPGDIIYFTLTVGKWSDGSVAALRSPHIKLIRNSTGKTPGETDLFSVKPDSGVYFGRFDKLSK